MPVVPNAPFFLSRARARMREGVTRRRVTHPLDATIVMGWSRGRPGHRPYNSLAHAKERSTETARRKGGQLQVASSRLTPWSDERAENPSLSQAPCSRTCTAGRLLGSSSRRTLPRVVRPRPRGSRPCTSRAVSRPSRIASRATCRARSMSAAAVDRVDVLDPHVKGPDLVPGLPENPGVHRAHRPRADDGDLHGRVLRWRLFMTLGAMKPDPGPSGSAASPARRRSGTSASLGSAPCRSRVRRRAAPTRAQGSDAPSPTRLVVIRTSSPTVRGTPPSGRAPLVRAARSRPPAAHEAGSPRPRRLCVDRSSAASSVSSRRRRDSPRGPRRAVRPSRARRRWSSDISRGEGGRASPLPDGGPPAPRSARGRAAGGG